MYNGDSKLRKQNEVMRHKVKSPLLQNDGLFLRRNVLISFFNLRKQISVVHLYCSITQIKIFCVIFRNPKDSRENEFEIFIIVTAKAVQYKYVHEK